MHNFVKINEQYYEPLITSPKVISRDVWFKLENLVTSCGEKWKWWQSYSWASAEGGMGGVGPLDFHTCYW